MSQEIRVVITGDSSQAEKALDRVDALLDQVSAPRQQQGAGGLERIAQGTKAIGDQSRYAREQMRNLSYQMTDIVTGLATGQNPFYVFLQQGGQLRDTFGGALPALKAVASVFTVVRVVAGGAAAAIAAVVIGMVKGAAESEALTKSLAATGNAAQVTAGQFEQQVQSISASSNLAIGDVREVATVMVQSGKLSAEAFAPAVEAASLYAKVTGKSTEDAAKDFAGLTQDAYKWAQGMARSYRAVDAATLENIRTLQAQGRSSEAVKLAAEAVAESFEGRVVRSQYAVVRGWNSLTKAIGEYWDALKGLGRDTTPEDRMADLRRQIEAIDEARAKGALPGAGIFRGEAQARSQLRALEGLTGAQRRAREQLADFQAKDDKEREENSEQGQQAIAGIEKAGIERRLALQQMGLERARAAYDQAWQQDLVEAQGYQAALLEIEMQGLAAKEQALRASQALAASSKPTSVNETRAQQAALLTIETELLRIEQERAKLRAAEASGERDIVPKARSVGPRDDLRRFENAERAGEQAISEQRRTAALTSASDLVAINKQLSVELIRDSEARLMAELALEEEALRKRLDLAALSDTARQAAIDDLAAWRVMREKQIGDELKPVWQRQLEDWRDINKLMREASDDMWSGMLQNGEDAWAQLVTTGKLSLGTLVRDFVAAQARLEFRKFFGGAGASNSGLFGSLMGFGSSIISGIGSLFGGGRAYGGDVHRGMLHQINERGVPEVLTVKGKDYLATGAASGRITPMKQSASVVSAPINQTLYIDSRTDQAQVAQIAARAVEIGQAQLIDNLRANRVIA